MRGSLCNRGRAVGLRSQPQRRTTTSLTDYIIYNSDDINVTFPRGFNREHVVQRCLFSHCLCCDGDAKMQQKRCCLALVTSPQPVSVTQYY